MNYEARAFGIKRGMRGEEAQAKCREHNQQLTVFHTPQRRGKADSSKYREASFEVFDVLTNYDSDLIVEKASIDEAYIDLTEYLDKNSDLELPTKDEMLDCCCYVEGIENDDEDVRDFDKFYDLITTDPETYKDEIKLLKGAKLIATLRRAILEKTEFFCSAGISHSKVLAKLAAGLHKPKSQTILPNCGKKRVLARTEINKLRSLGGKFGHQIVERLNIQYVDQINSFTIEQLRALFDEKTADYMLNLANGVDDEKVVSRKLSKTIGCGKNFSSAGTNCLNSKEQVEHWIGQLVEELLERLDRDKELNNRRPNLLVLSMDQVNIGMLSRSTQFEYFGKERLIEILMSKILNPILFKKENKTKHPVRMLSVAATKFTDLVDSKNTIESFFQKMQSKQPSAETTTNNIAISNKPSTSTTGSIVEEVNEQRSKTEFQNLNCKKMMDEYFRELEADIVNRPKEVSKPKLTILNMFNKIAEKTGQDLTSKKDNEQTNDQNDDRNNVRPVKEPKPNPIIDLINKNNQRLKQQTVPTLITLDDDDPNQPSTSNQLRPTSSFAAEQLELIRRQGLLDEVELKKLEDEFLRDDRPRVAQKIGFFRRKTLELKEKRRLNTKS